MLIGYARVSKADGSQSLDLQRDAPIAAGVAPEARDEFDRNSVLVGIRRDSGHPDRLRADSQTRRKRGTPCPDRKRPT